MKCVSVSCELERDLMLTIFPCVEKWKKNFLCVEKKKSHDFLFQIKLGNSEAQQVALSSGLESYKDTGSRGVLVTQLMDPLKPLNHQNTTVLRS